MLNYKNNNTDKRKPFFMVFELWDKTTMELVACSFGYQVGSILHDYTFLTLKHDKRSIGNILTRVVGDILLQCNMDLWYWGFPLEYMKEYSHYIAKLISRTEFANVFLKHGLSNEKNNVIINYSNKTVQNIIDFVKNGNALVQPFPQWINSL